MALRKSDARTALNGVQIGISRANAAVISDLTNFAQQVDALDAMTDSGSTAAQTIAAIIAEAEATENLTDSFWQALKSEAEGAETDISERLTKYAAALPTVQALAAE